MKILFILIILALPFQLISQESVKGNYSTLILNSTDGNLFSNQDFFDSIISNKRIILLGELNHGDGSSFELKTKLVKYLHQNHGFNTLVFESGLIDAESIQRSVQNGISYAQSAGDHIYYIWSKVRETKELFEYLDNNYRQETPINVVGIDPQFSGTEAYKVFTDLLRKELGSSETESKRFKEFEHELKIMSRWLQYPDKDEHHLTESGFHIHLQYYKDLILSKYKGKKKELWQLFFENVETFARIKWVKRKGSFEMRDRQMFKNLEYHINKDTSQKIIIWAANAHIIRNDNELTGKDSDYKIIGLKKLGDHIFKVFPDVAYSIAITAGKGRTLNFLNKKKTHKLGKHSTGSLEYQLRPFKNVFVDLELFEDHFNLDAYESQLFYPNVRCISKWSRHFDGVIYIEEMKPSSPLW